MRLSRRVLLTGTLAAACGPRPPPTVPVAGGPDGAETLHTERGDVRIDHGDPQDGPETAPTVLVVFADFQCPYCAEAASTVASERRAHPGKSRLIFKHYPLTMHPRARGLSMLAQSVFLSHGAAAFWTLHDRLFARQTATDEEVRSWVIELGVTQAELDVVADRAAEKVGAGITAARLLGLSGAPGIFVNARFIDGSPAPQLLRAVVG